MLEHQYRRWLATALAAGVCLVVVSVVVASGHGEVGPAETSVFDAVNGLPDQLGPVMYVLQLAGVLAVGPLVALVAAAFRKWSLAIAALLVTVGKLVSERLIKLVVERERPAVSIGPEVERRGDVPDTGLSYASGHVILTVGLATVVAPYLPARWQWLPWAVVVGNAIARVYVGAHNPLDVVGGACIGVIVGSLVNLCVGTPTREVSVAA